MGRGTSKAGGGGKADPLAKFDSNAFKATYATDIKAGDKITDKVIDEATGQGTHKMWTFHPDNADTFKAYPYDLTVQSVKVSNKTTTITALFDKAMTKSNPQPSDWGKDFIKVTKTFKNNEIIQKRKPKK